MLSIVGDFPVFEFALDEQEELQEASDYRRREVLRIASVGNRRARRGADASRGEILARSDAGRNVRILQEFES